MASRELRTPLAAMLGYAEVLQEGIYGAFRLDRRYRPDSSQSKGPWFVESDDHIAVA
jgi:signal transduction histidine kinase